MTNKILYFNLNLIYNLYIMSYEEKYIKYKKKYLELKEQLEGGDICLLLQNKAACSSKPGCVNKYAGSKWIGCTHKICQGRNRAGCAITSGCTWSDHTKSCMSKSNIPEVNVNKVLHLRTFKTPIL